MTRGRLKGGHKFPVAGMAERSVEDLWAGYRYHSRQWERANLISDFAALNEHSAAYKAYMAEINHRKETGE